MTPREEIIKYLLDSGLVDRCVKYQTKKADPYLKEELTQELWLWLFEYDISKLSDAYENKHMNALITRWLQNQFHSKNSPFYKRYRKWQAIEEDITDYIKTI